MRASLRVKSIYLNNAATSFPKPASVHAAIEKSIAQIPAETFRSTAACKQNDSVSLCRNQISRLLSVSKAAQVVLTPGATYSLNLLIQGLLHENDRVLTTTIEHNSVIRPLTYISKKKHITIEYISCNREGFIYLDSLEEKCNKKMHAFIFSLAGNVTGAVQDINAITGIIRKKQPDCLIIADAAQAAGLVPLNPESIGLDGVALAGHKYLLGPGGTGAVWLREGLFPDYLLTGGTGIRSDLTTQPEDMPIRYEAGTYNISGFAGLSAGVEYVNNNFQSIQKTVSENFLELLSMVEPIKNLKIYNCTDKSVIESGKQNPILCFNIAGLLPDETAMMLADNYGIVTRSGLHCAPLIHQAIGAPKQGSVRASLSIFTRREEIFCFAEALKEIAGAVV